MTLTERNGLRILTPSEGMILSNKEKTLFAEYQVYLGCNSSEKDYIEITPQERDKRLQEMEAEREQQK